MTKTRIAAVVGIMGTLAILAGIAVASAQVTLPPPPQFPQVTYQYAAKFVCGFNSQDRIRVAPGLYTTAINIFNPSNQTVEFRKKVALTYPPKEQRPGKLSDPISHLLPPHHALAVDCEEIPREFFGSVGTPYSKGFLVIESRGSLDVTAVYTSGGRDSWNQSIDVEQINERRIPLQ